MMYICSECGWPAERIPNPHVDRGDGEPWWAMAFSCADIHKVDDDTKVYFVDDYDGKVHWG